MPKRIRLVVDWTQGQPQKIGSVEWPDQGAGGELVAITLDGRRLTIDECIAQLDDERPIQRRYAACFLQGLAAERAIESLSRLLDDPDPLVRRQVAQTISEIKRGGERRVALSQTHGHGSNSSQESPVNKPRDEQVVEQLIHTLNDEDRAACTNAAASLGFLGDNRAVEALIQALREGHDSLRAKAAWALGKIRDERAVMPLIEALMDPCRDVRHWSVIALTWFADQRAVGPLIALVNNPDEEKGTLSNAIRALGRLGGKQAISGLLGLFDVFEAFLCIAWST